ncbi:hypothetical protein STEG23_005787 [Scotinomys teguina]
MGPSRPQPQLRTRTGWDGSGSGRPGIASSREPESRRGVDNSAEAERPSTELWRPGSPRSPASGTERSGPESARGRTPPAATPLRVGTRPRWPQSLRTWSAAPRASDSRSQRRFSQSAPGPAPAPARSAPGTTSTRAFAYALRHFRDVSDFRSFEVAGRKRSPTLGSLTTKKAVGTKLRELDTSGDPEAIADVSATPRADAVSPSFLIVCFQLLPALA